MPTNYPEPEDDFDLNEGLDDLDWMDEEDGLADIAKEFDEMEKQFEAQDREAYLEKLAEIEAKTDFKKWVEAKRQHEAKNLNLMTDQQKAWGHQSPPHIPLKGDAHPGAPQPSFKNYLSLECPVPVSWQSALNVIRSLPVILMPANFEASGVEGRFLRGRPIEDGWFGEMGS